MRLVEGFFIEKLGIFPLEHFGAEIMTNRVIGLVAQHRRQPQQPNAERQTHQPQPAHRTDNEQQRVAR